MLRTVVLVLAVATSLVPPTVASAASAEGRPVHGKPHASRHWHGYGFLPGYRPPEQRGPGPGYWMGAPGYDLGRHFWFGYPGYYHGRWNGGGFGPCWTYTPIGMYWNCG